MQHFNALVRVALDVQDLVENGACVREFNFNNPSELNHFLELLEQARIDARLKFAQDSNELS